MDFFDFIPLVPPGLPGEQRANLTPAQRFAAGAASTLLPAINFTLVLFAGFASHGTTALVVMPLVSAAVVLLLSLRLSIPTAWSIVLGFGCAAFCFTANGVALLLVGFTSFFSTF